MRRSSQAADRPGDTTGGSERDAGHPTDHWLAADPAVSVLREVIRRDPADQLSAVT
jgi:hypothetical protein